MLLILIFAITISITFAFSTTTSVLKAQISPLESMEIRRSRLYAKALGKGPPTLAPVSPVFAHHHSDGPTGVLGKPEAKSGIRRPLDRTQHQVDVRTRDTEVGADRGAETTYITFGTDVQAAQAGIEVSVGEAESKQDEGKSQREAS